MKKWIFEFNPAILFLILFISGCSLITRDKEIYVDSTQYNQDLFTGNPDSCSMCHANIEIAIFRSKTKHMEEGIDCITCHGISQEHIVNEINEVKPTRVITRATANSFCEDCHECSTPEDKRTSPNVCIDCHDAHVTFIPSE